MADPNDDTVGAPNARTRRAGDEAQVSTVGALVDPGDPAGASLPGARYGLATDKLGEGGMGVVWAVEDRLIGRHVAMKVMRADAGLSPPARAMFLREARVQGQLEHPAIVPVYDVGIDPGGAAYFTMKRVTGATLAEVLRDVRAGKLAHAPRRLLTAFASLCLAIDFSHQRGVVHRDLKPSNVMLGNFGEVSVLDWGVARVLRDESRPGEAVRLPSEVAPPREEEQSGRTRAAGTPGYMAPEQTAGRDVGPPADVYALGAILYELLALQPLHKLDRGPSDPLPPMGALTPELAAICQRAIEPDPRARYRTARALHDAIEDYLDGERAVDLRRALAGGHLARARKLAAEAGTAARQEALREIGRALALDPEDTDAHDLLYRIFAEVPADAPPEVERELEAAQAEQRRITARTSAIGYASVLGFVPLLWWIGVRDARALAAFLAFSIAAALASGVQARRPRGGLLTIAVLTLSTIAFSLCSTMYGPFILVPTMIATNTMALGLHMNARERAIAIAVGVLGVVAPIGMAALGWFPSSYVFGGGQLAIRPLMLALPGAPTTVFLTLASAVMVLTGTRSAGQVRDALLAAERRVLTQRWYLRQLLPARRW